MTQLHRLFPAHCGWAIVAIGAAVSIAACRDVPTSPRPRESVQPDTVVFRTPGETVVRSFRGALADWRDTIYVQYDITSPKDIRRVRVSLPGRQVVLHDTTVSRTTRSLSRIHHFEIADWVSTVGVVDALNVMLTVDLDGGQSVSRLTTAVRQGLGVGGRLDGRDHNIFHAVGDTARVLVWGQASVPLMWVGARVQAVGHADSIAALDTPNGPEHYSPLQEVSRVVFDRRWLSSGPGFGLPIVVFARDVLGRHQSPYYPIVPMVVDARRVAAGPRASIGYPPMEVLVDRKRDVAYLFWADSTWVAVLDLARMQFRQPMLIDGAPGWPAFSISGDSLFVPYRNRPAVGVFNLLDGSRQEIAITDVAHHDRILKPWAVGPTANGHLFVSVGFTPDGNSWLIDVDLATGTQRRRTDLAEQGWLADCARFAPGAHAAQLLVTYQKAWTGRRVVAVYDARTDNFTEETSYIGLCFGAVSVTSDGARYLLGDQIIERGSGTVTVLRTPFGGSEFGDPGHPAAFSDDGSVVYLATKYGVAIARTSDGVVFDGILTPLPVPHTQPDPWHVLPLASPGELLLVTPTEAIRTSVR